MDSLLPILYVDDEKPNLMVFEAAFEDFYDVHTAISGAEALEILASQEIRLVIADQRMPGMTGVELLETIVDEYPEIGRIILTGYVDVDAIVEAINAGQIDQYLTKPWDEKELRITIDQSLERYELLQNNRKLMEELQHKAAREVQIRKVFQRYVPPTVVDEFLDSANDRFHAESRNVSVLVCDIRGFTKLSSRLDPPQVVQFLNRYFAVMGAIISLHRGIISRLLGDAIVAVFGAPVLVSDHQDHALRAALDMIAALKTFNRDEAIELVGQEIHIGIGLHSGPVVFGNMGSSEKIEHRIIGETVAIAEQIEQLTKPSPDSILISQAVYDQARDLVEVEPGPTLAFTASGQARPLPLYWVTGQSTDARIFSRGPDSGRFHVFSKDKG